MSPMGHRTNQYVQYIMEAMGLLQLLFGVLRILRTLMEWNGTEHDHMTVRNCSGYTNFEVEATRTRHVTRDSFSSD